MMPDKKPDELILSVAVGRGVGDEIEVVEMPWPKLVNRLSKAAIDSTIKQAEYSALPNKQRIPYKSRRGYYVLGDFEGSTRNNLGVKTRSGLMIDIEDGNNDLEDIISVLGEWDCFIHSSRSHRPDDQRYRVIIPLAEPISPDEYEALTTYLCDTLETFDIVVDRGTSTRLSQPAFFPTLSSDQTFIAHHNQARVMSLADLPADYIPADQTSDFAGGLDLKAKEDITTEELARALSHLQDEADDRNTWVSYGMALYHQYDGNAEGLELWDQWSQYSGKYPGFDDIEKRWAGFHVVGYRTKTVRSILSDARSNGWRLSRVDLGEMESPDDFLKAARITDYLYTPAPPINWLIPDFIPADKVGGIVAAGGTGKSFAFLQIAFSIATGYPLFGHWQMEGTPGKVLIMAAEDDRDDLHRRIQALIESIEVAFPGDEERKAEYTRLASENMLVISRVGKDNLLTASVDNTTIKTKLVDSLIDLCKRIDDFRLLMIDPVARFRGGEENNQEDATRFIETLEHIRSKVGCSLLYAHHTSKHGDKRSQGASRGASALTDAARWQTNMFTMPEDEAHHYGLTTADAAHYVNLRVTKTNYTAPIDNVWLHREAGGILKFVDLQEQTDTGRGAEPDVVKERISEIVKRREMAGEMVSVRELKNDYSGVNNELGISKDHVRTIVDEMIEARTLDLVSGGRGGGKLLRLVTD